MSKDKKPETPHEGFSRRDFLRGGTAGALSTGLLTQALGTATVVGQSGPAVSGPGRVPMSFNVNGKKLQAELEPRTTLLDALRDEFLLTGSKRVCDRASCGACTVLVEGKPVYSCTLLAVEAQGREIVTVEGVGSVEELHPIQAAFVRHDAQQCGFCTPGFVVAAKAMLDRNGNPTVDDVHKELGGNVCRCGTYAGLRKAVLEVGKGGGSHG